MDGGAWQAAVHGVARSQTLLSDFTFTFHFHASEKEMASHSSVLAWRIPGTGEPGGLPSMGSYRVRHDWSNLAAAVAATSLNIWHLYGISRKGKKNLSDRKDYTVEWDWEVYKWEWGLSYWGDRNVPKLHNNDYCTTQKILIKRKKITEFYMKMGVFIVM